MLNIIEPRIEVIAPEVKDWYKLLHVVEICGRVSHKSEGAITATSAPRFIQKVAVKLRHESILEHSVITIRFVCSRACSHQLVRHRIAAFTQESMRYCDYAGKAGAEGLQVIVPPSIRQDPSALQQFRESCTLDYRTYKALRALGHPAEDARFALPYAT